jgi:flagellar protein FliO/FliZ
MHCGGYRQTQPTQCLKDDFEIPGPLRRTIRVQSGFDFDDAPRRYGMREVLESIFGEFGAVVAQFIVTLIVILLLVAAIYWLFQRFLGGSLITPRRGRNPRLAIIDALPIDHRRKLVLIRRDNIEHLILVGGAADLVVESSMIRGTQPGARPRQAQMPRPHSQHGTAAAAGVAAALTPQPAPPLQTEKAGLSEPVAYAQIAQPQQSPPAQSDEIHRTKPKHSDPATVESKPPEQPSTHLELPEEVSPVAAESGPPASVLAHFEEPMPASETGGETPVEKSANEIVDRLSPANDTTEIIEPDPSPEPASAAPQAPAASALDSDAQEAVDVDMQPAPTAPPGDSESNLGPMEAENTESAAKVSSLEQDMARLLGQITTKRAP